MAHLRRGIAPEILLSQVRNTMPYLFLPETEGTPLIQFIPAQILREYDKNQNQELTHFEYFRLCASSHFLTCATPVPTDVDNQIRLKLWPADLPLEVALQMADWVLDSRQWDFTWVSTRYTYGFAESPWAKEPLSGHLGEWFTLACAAYCALKHYRSPFAKSKRQDFFDAIAAEIHRHSEIFGSLWRAHEGLSCLKASAHIAHNFGDLDRVMDMWDLPIEDPLRLEFYKLATTPFNSNQKLRYLGRLWVAGELYKSPIDGSSMALENHRHFALRKPRCLRQKPLFLIPNGPFFDDWGKHVASSENSMELAEVVEALKHGWERLPKTVGYGRALRGMSEICPEVRIGPVDKVTRSQTTLDMPQSIFERLWNDEALRHMDDIPSRA